MNEESRAIDSLILDLLEWVAQGDRTYEEVMDAWRTNCPRLTVWEDASDRGLIAVEQLAGDCLARPTPLGDAFLKARRLPTSIPQ